MKTVAIFTALRVALVALAAMLAFAPCSRAQAVAPRAGMVAGVDKLFVVDCLLPGQVRQLGQRLTYLGPRRPTKVSAEECEIRGGEYVAYDRASLSGALAVWMPLAQQGDQEAQTYVGEIYERGIAGSTPDFASAATWYRKAADQGFARAAVNLGFLYEKGLGVPRDAAAALNLYRKAAGLPGLIALDSAGKPAGPTSDGPLVIEPPTIQLFDPPLVNTRTATVVRVPAGTSRREVTGKVTAAAGVLAFTVNNRSEPIDASGLFATRIDVSGATSVTLVALDNQGKRAVLEFMLVPEGATTAARTTGRATLSSVEFGSYHALVIGNAHYRKLPSLDTAIEDARAVSDVLSRKYGFKVTTLLDADRYTIVSELNRLRSRLTIHDNLLIYYAGHGEIDRANLRGNWLPVDAEADNNANWISSADITGILNAMAVQHVLVVADSCYSGALTRSAIGQVDPALDGEARNAMLKALAKARSRTVLTSGGVEPVMDGGGGQHSVFAQSFLDVLAHNQDPIEGQRLYREVAARVVDAARRFKVDQQPEYAPMQFAGHEAGDFLLIPAALASRASDEIGRSVIGEGRWAMRDEVSPVETVRAQARIARLQSGGRPSDERLNDFAAARDSSEGQTPWR
jgi:uncharacterized protein